MASTESYGAGHGIDGPGSTLLARQLGRLVEDFVQCDEAGRFEIAALAQELAEERLRRAGAPPEASGPSS